jgi:nitrite reductase/ring-hydroxylating ferredoxin subunit
MKCVIVLCPRYQHCFSPLSGFATSAACQRSWEVMTFMVKGAEPGREGKALLFVRKAGAWEEGTPRRNTT